MSRPADNNRETHSLYPTREHKTYNHIQRALYRKLISQPVNDWNNHAYKCIHLQRVRHHLLPTRYNFHIRSLADRLVNIRDRASRIVLERRATSTNFFIRYGASWILLDKWIGVRQVQSFIYGAGLQGYCWTGVRQVQSSISGTGLHGYCWIGVQQATGTKFFLSGPWHLQINLFPVYKWTIKSIFKKI